MHFFLYFAQELTWGPAIRGTRLINAPDWRWLHVGEMAVFFLVPALFLTFYCGNWPRRFGLPVNVLIRTVITIAAAILLYIFYYMTSHDFLGTQKGFMHEQQFPMIPTIWLINIWLVHHWFMDNWPAWKMVPKTAEEIAADHAAERRSWPTSGGIRALGWGLGAGALCGLAVYFVALNILPWVYKSITVIK